MHQITQDIFLMGKKEVIIKEKHQKSILEYIGSIKKVPKGAIKNRERQQKTTSPQPKPNQSTKSIMELEQLRPHPKITKERKFKLLNQMPLIFKRLTISFLPNCLE